MNVEPETPQPEDNAPSQKPSRRPGIPAWTLGLLILALTAALVWAGNAYIRSRQQPPGQTPLPAPSATRVSPTTRPPTATPASAATRAPTATPLPTPAEPRPATRAETLILVAGLYSGGPDPDADLTRRFHETLVARIEENDLQSRVHAERLDEPVGNDDAARAAGRAQDADYVLWGSAPESGAGTPLKGIHMTRVGTQVETRTTPQGYDLTLNVLSQHDLQTSGPQEAWVDGAVDMFLAIAADRWLDLEEANLLWDRALDAAQQIEAPAFTADLHLYRGNARAFGGDYDGAVAEYDAAIESAPDQAKAYTNRGTVRHAQQDDGAALEDVNRALELDPGLANAYYARSAIYREQEQDEKAREDLDRALELDPQHAPALASRGLLHHNAGDHEAALKDYTRALELDPEASEVYLNRGGTYATLGQFEDALDDYTRAIELDPDDADAYYNRGTVHAMLSAYGQALADLDRALALKPDFAQVYGNRGLVYKAMGDTEKAVADLERFLEMSDNPEWQEMIEQQLAELKGE
jgi:tetratricopeptide (TPR) repeat protein